MGQTIDCFAEMP